MPGTGDERIQFDRIPDPPADRAAAGRLFALPVGKYQCGMVGLPHRRTGIRLIVRTLPEENIGKGQALSPWIAPK